MTSSTGDARTAGATHFNAKPPAPYQHPAAVGFHRKLLREYEDDGEVYEQLRNLPDFPLQTQRKLKQRADFRALREQIGADPVIVGIASKDEVYKKDKVAHFLDLLFTPLAMLGVKLSQGSGPNGMKLFGSRYNRAMRLVAGSGYRSLWTPGVIGVSLNIAEEPLNREHTRGWHHGPWRDVSRRTDALAAIGYVPAVIGLHSGDSGLLEFFRYKTARKPGQVDVLDGPFNGYPTMPHLLQVEHEGRVFWGHIHEAQRSMSASMDSERAARKARELKELQAECLWINGGIEQEAERAFNLIDAKMGRIYGLDPTIEWQRVNNTDRSVFHLGMELIAQAKLQGREKTGGNGVIPFRKAAI